MLTTPANFFPNLPPWLTGIKMPKRYSFGSALGAMKCIWYGVLNIIFQVTLHLPYSKAGEKRLWWILQHTPAGENETK